MESSQPAPIPLPRPPYAGLGRRIVAHLLDILIAFSVVLLVGVLLRIFRAVGLWMPGGQEIPPEQTWRALGIAAKLFVVLVFVFSMGPIYFILWEASAWQATFGKRLLNIYVTDDRGNRINIARSASRWLVKWVCSGFGGNVISIITIASTGNRKAIHDLVGGTTVVGGRPVPGGSLEPWRIAAGFGIPLVWILGTCLATL